ncbi:hypothetical protein AB0953_30210 [Streptomyces sp. NPDC046866]|uniref:hypothetical protein n=1 Tax=Streptomyces sp. NPDC046866 TaxID=3154921 RepID=UPI0034551768
MSRRTRPRAASTVRIPRQRGGQPVILVLSPEPQPLITRAALAAGRWAWKHRRSWAPTGLATALLVLTGAIHVTEPRIGWALAVFALAPAGVWAWGMLRRRPTSRQAVVWRALLAAFAAAGGAWVALAVGFGPAHPALFTAWAVLTLISQTGWLVARRLSSVTEKETR